LYCAPPASSLECKFTRQVGGSRRVASAAGRRLAWLTLIVLCAPLRPAAAEDGYELWLRYPPLPVATRDADRRMATEIVAGQHTPTLDLAEAELARGLGGLLGAVPPIRARPSGDGSLVIGTPASSPFIAALRLDLAATGGEGFLIRSLEHEGRRLTVIAGRHEAGVLYGTFTFLRLLATERSPERLNLVSAPRVRRRILDHWDNLDRTVERGYAGESIWDWQKLPDYLDPRYRDYARASASLGINGTVLTNVNSDPVSLTRRYLLKYAALAGLFRPYGLRVYVTAPFDSPIAIGGLRTADPLDPQVRAWWRAKVEEIYALIPDFGGFLVKANSEGRPGPEDYGRTHADGANMLARALAPHGGIVMWRAFVYSERQSPDRARQAFDEFKPLDGKFERNVLLQVKNGPIDFQPREPFHPLFGAMPRTSLMLELQITKEYLGFATHLVYLGPLFEETLRSDTFARGPGSTVARVIDGSLFDRPQSGMAGVANIGSGRNWSGSVFDQANWYAFGRLAWDPTLLARDIAEEWVRLTFSNDPLFVAPVVGMMMASREATVDYMTPLGLAHQMAASHYGPAPWLEASRYFNRADAQGIGFDRTATGSNAVAQYAAPVAARFQDLRQVPPELLLWFHHVPWDYRMPPGRTLWEELLERYARGVTHVADMQRTWAGLAGRIDAERFAEVEAYLAIQEKEARWWRDANVAYFQSLSRRALPAGYPPPEHDLAYYEALCFPYVPGVWDRREPLCR
jgi:alpha-glucuronidase